MLPAQTDGRGEWQLVPRLTRAQELVYRGSYVHETAQNGVQFNRTYRMESRVFVLDTPPRGADVALLTTWRLQTPPRTERAEESLPGSVRLELVKVDLQGRLTPEKGVSLAVPLEGPPSIECGEFVELPRGRVAADKPWHVDEEGRPPHMWHVAGNEQVNGVVCVKLEGKQQTDDWEFPRADRSAWRRRDTVWMSPSMGIAFRVERIIERKEPAHREPSQRTVLRYELENPLTYPGKLFEDRRREIQQAKAFAESAEPLLANPGKYKLQIEALEAKLAFHMDGHPATPYRDAIMNLKRRLDAARRGDTPPALLHEEVVDAGLVIALHRAAPDFVTPIFDHDQPARLKSMLGKPIVMVFYSPTSTRAAELLRFAQSLGDTYKDHGLVVLGLSVSDDADKVKKQRDALKLTIPLLQGSGLRIRYGVEATPKVIVIDRAGVVRGQYLGWGAEMPHEITAELKQWLPAAPSTIRRVGAEGK
jgi:peroxiredoxin